MHLSVSLRVLMMINDERTIHFTTQILYSITFWKNKYFANANCAFTRFTRIEAASRSFTITSSDFTLCTFWGSLIRKQY